MNTETVPEKKVFENDNAVHNKVDIFLKIEKSLCALPNNTVIVGEHLQDQRIPTLIKIVTPIIKKVHFQ